jgi:hypothetical protein
MWMTLLGGVLKRPWIIALVVMGVAMGGMWININVLKGDIVDLRADIVRVESNFKTCKVNENTLLVSIEEQNGSIDSLNTIIVGLQDQVKAEQKTAVTWERKYKNRPVITKIKEVPVIEYVEKGVVVDEETSKEYIDYFNILFGD